MLDPVGRGGNGGGGGGSRVTFPLISLLSTDTDLDDGGDFVIFVFTIPTSMYTFLQIVDLRPQCTRASVFIVNQYPYIGAEPYFAHRSGGGIGFGSVYKLIIHKLIYGRQVDSR